MPAKYIAGPAAIRKAAKTKRPILQQRSAGEEAAIALRKLAEHTPKERYRDKPRQKLEVDSKKDMKPVHAR
jgi:hypothetical protein